MDFDLEKAWDSVKEGTKDIAEVAHVKIKEFHKNYVSKAIPDCGKYGDKAKFLVEMVPGVSEYNAIVEGDWIEFAVSAGIDIGALVFGTFTAGTGYAAIKGGSVAAKTSTKKAVKEITEAGTKKVVKKISEDSIEKITKEVVEAGAQKAAKEIAMKNIDEIAEEGVEKTVKETTEKVASKGRKEIGTKLNKTLFPEYLQEVEKITNREIKPNQMEKLQKALKEQEFEKLDPEKSKLHKRLFNNARDKLIAEWEKNTGDKWPVYEKDELNEAGEVIRKANQPYDAHHLIESSYGGPNAWWNLHPAAFPSEHQAMIHGAGSLASIIF